MTYKVTRKTIQEFAIQADTELTPAEQIAAIQELGTFGEAKGDATPISEPTMEYFNVDTGAKL